MIESTLVRQLSLLSVACVAGPIAAGLAGEPQQALTGRLDRHEGLPVLTLWGTPEQAGYAHGYLMAEQIVALLDGYMLDPKVIPNPGVYETVLRPTVRTQFTWTEAQVAELTAMLAGVRDRLGDGARLDKLDRELQLEDLMAANTLADWFGFMCSTFSAWGTYTEGGRLVTARNLDFPQTETMERLQCVIVYRGQATERAWIGVSWPGLIGVYTAMNADGVTLLMHDAPGLPPDQLSGVTPRSLALRDVLEAAAPDGFIDTVRKTLGARRAIIGNNVHVSAPVDGDGPMAAVFEYDGNAQDSGVTVRLPEKGSDALSQAIWCTNHMRARRPAEECWRYGQIKHKLMKLVQADQKLTVERAFALLEHVRQDTTLHSIVTEPESGSLHVRIRAVHDGVVTFAVREWLTRELEAAQP